MNQKKAAVLVLALSVLAACSKQENKPLPTDTQRFHMKGKVISVDKQSHMATIDSEEIPGFMSAMAMPYIVKPETVLDTLAPGDAVTAEVVSENGSYWLENVVVTGHSAAPPAKPAAALHVPEPGDAVPDFQLVNQSGKKISLRQYRGKALILSFIYTRCPFPDYCPRVINQFAAVDRELQKSDIYARTHLLNISFDPQHDTPKVLRDYARVNSAPSGFHHWEFAVTPAAQLAALAQYFGLAYKPEGGLITHSLSTAVVGPDGKIFKWYHGNDWQASDLLKDAADSLHAST